jgi:DNA-directed RNA polymerase specialized sigma24 family protein
MARPGELAREEETVRLLALLVRMQTENQAQAIIELGRAGFTPGRIATLLGTTADTAKVTLARARKRSS